ncbi:MAG: phosphate regulon sensor histidine kinase PhoR [Gammaproteobacteria bacterium]
MRHSIQIEIGRFLTIVGLAVFLGLFFGHLESFVLVAITTYLFWHLYNIWLLARWLSKYKTYTPPQSSGVWGDIFDEIYRLLKRQRKRNKRFTNLLRRFRESTDAMPDGVVIMHQHGEIEWWNTVAGEWLGLRYPQDVEQRITNLIRLPDFSSFWTSGKEDDAIEISGPVNQQQRLRVRIIPYGQQQKLLLLRDITAFSNVENMRRDFIANISHELRTPLTVMSGYLETLSEEKEFDEKLLRRSLQLMKQQSKRMYHLVEDLMLLSRLENDQKPVKHEVVVVPQILAGLREEAQVVSGERNHQITMDIDDDLYIYGDSKELDSAFSNLLINAVNYTPAGGAINVRWYEDEAGANLSVSDTGIGIPPHHLSRITERFYRVDVARSRNTGGSGLGLSIVKHALNHHGATLGIDSEVGRGSTFVCHFPRSCIVHKDEARKID